ncbi:MAG: sugar-binding protein [Spirochaetales bacterium]|nr:sugar-binding protein [Spirochaetales bacterium]
MRNISKAVMIMLVLCLSVSVFAGGTPDQGGSNMIGVAMPTKSLQRWNQDGAYLKEKLEANGFTVDLQYANNDVSTQVNQLENMITKGCKVLVIASIDSTALKGVLQQAADNGVKVVAYDRLIMETPNCDYYATFDNYKVGQIQGEFIVDKMGLASGKGPFNMEVFGGSPDDNNAYLFNQGAMDALKPYIAKGQLVINSGQTDMSVIAIKAWKPEGSQARMDNLLTAYYADKKLDVVLSPNDSLAQGIVASLKAAGYGSADKPFPVLTGQDCDKINVKMMINGEQSMSVFKDTRTLAERVVIMVSDIMNGKTPEVNDTTNYDNGVKVVPSYLCVPVFADKNNYKQILIDSGYYKESDLK